MVFASPGAPGLAELAGDFKIHFHERQGDFYCWLNTTMTENRKVLNTSNLDGFDKRKLLSPGFLVEVVLVDYNGNVSSTTQHEAVSTKSDETSSNSDDTLMLVPLLQLQKKSGSNDKDDVFSDGEGEDSGYSKSRQTKAASQAVGSATNTASGSESNKTSDQILSLAHATEQVSLGDAASAPIQSASEHKTDDGRQISSVKAPSQLRK